MFALKYINRHLFLEHDGRLYLVDTGCPRSFAINNAVPWTDKTPHSVILDMRKGQLRFTYANDKDPCEGTAHPFTKASGTKAPIFRCHPDSKMIWDTGAQIGYIDMSTLPPKKIVKEMGCFVDFSPIYGPIESPMTWLFRFDLQNTIDLGQIELISYIHCRMADAPQRIITDIRREGADGVLGNDWMVERGGVITTIKGQEGCVYIQNIPFELHPVFVDYFGNKKPQKMDVKKALADLDKPKNPAILMRTVPSSLGAFTTEGLRRHIELENIYGLIGNDLLLDTVL